MISRFDTIVAAATPPGRGALGIVRLDGEGAFEVIRTMTRAELPRVRAASLRTFHDAAGVIDEAIVTLYRAPASYSGNNLAEVSLHGSPYVIGRFIEAAIEAGARPAEPGEFTERAVLNGKIDLVQAESVVDLIDSRTALQARLALSNLDGALSRTAEEIRSALVDMMARFEGALDFADEGYEFISAAEARESLLRAIGQSEELLATYDRGRATVQGIEAAILGRPNGGKSTLLNFLCGSERAIVTPIAGTTRDLLREVVEVGGLPVTLIDTAGLRESADLVEEIGIGRAREVAARADLVIYLIDASIGLTEEDRVELARYADPMVIYSKTDLAPPPAGAFGVSLQSGEGRGELLARLDARVRQKFAVPEGSAAIVNVRQRAAVAACAAALREAVASIDVSAHEELIAVDLRRAANAIGLLTGSISSDEVLDAVFAKFCIGK